jgi:hypothetical protein
MQPAVAPRVSVFVVRIEKADGWGDLAPPGWFG